VSQVAHNVVRIVLRLYQHTGRFSRTAKTHSVSPTWSLTRTRRFKYSHSEACDPTKICPVFDFVTEKEGKSSYRYYVIHNDGNWSKDEITEIVSHSHTSLCDTKLTPYRHAASTRAPKSQLKPTRLPALCPQCWPASYASACTTTYGITLISNLRFIRSITKNTLLRKKYMKRCVAKIKPMTQF
jgi:hypothetical protein